MHEKRRPTPTNHHPHTLSLPLSQQVREEPVVTPLGPKEAEYTCVTFEPDLARYVSSASSDN